ncbi:hypothetical protein ACHMXB_17865 [Arthrobacter sp. UC242_113]|uniref:hypothetical protein n=1 Tax=Arthrobacter sp. UC242_113 TaxID=3374550 RepID=UPI0037576FA2
MSTLIASTSRQHRLRAQPASGGEPARLNPLEPVPNWCKLSRADEVTVCRDRRKVAAGRVDMVALDGSVFLGPPGGRKGPRHGPPEGRADGLSESRQVPASLALRDLARHGAARSTLP